MRKIFDPEKQVNRSPDSKNMAYKGHKFNSREKNNQVSRLEIFTKAYVASISLNSPDRVIEFFMFNIPMRERGQTICTLMVITLIRTWFNLSFFTLSSTYISKKGNVFFNGFLFIEAP